MAAYTTVWTEGFNGDLSNWTQSTAFTYSTTQNHNAYTGAGAAYCAAGASSQMYRSFARPFADAHATAYFWDYKGGYKSGVCGGGFRQALSLRNAASVILDNGISQNGATSYTWRQVGAGGSGVNTAYATRNPNTSCNPAWILYEITVTPGATTATWTASVTDGAGTTTSAAQTLSSTFFSYGIERVTLGLGTSSTPESYWDDIKFEATAPASPTGASGTANSTSQITWSWTRADNNVFGFDVTDGSTAKAPAYPNSGWLTRAATSWAETGLAANTNYTRYVVAWNGSLTAASGAVSRYTLADAPTAGTNVTAPASGTYTFAAWPGLTNPQSFGTGNKVSKFKYKWSASGSDSIVEGEGTDWSGGTMTAVPGTAGTYYLYMRSYNGNAVGNGSTKFGPYTLVSDATPPTIANITVNPENVGSTGNCLKGKLWVDAEVTDVGGSGLSTVEIKLDSGEFETMPAKVGGNPEDYEKEYVIDASWTNGPHSVTIKASDGAANTATADPVSFNVNKNQVSGAIGLQGLTAAPKYRDVAFVLNGSTTKVVNLGFLNGMAAYSIVDVPDLTTISAKTAWSLRRLITGLSASDGQYVADFTGNKVVLGGDLNGDNVVNALDYSILRGAWGSGGAGDINGDGYTDNGDYLIMKSNWYGKGDAQ